MTITLSDLQVSLIDALGTSETNLYTPDKRNRAINRAIFNILQWYDIDAYRKTTTLNFVSGVASAPSDLLRDLQLRESSSNTEYFHVDFEDFQRKSSNAYIYEYNTDNDGYDIKIVPAATRTLSFTYMQMPPEITDGTSTIRFQYWWKDAIAYEAAALLFLQTRNYNSQEAAQNKANQLKGDAWQSERQKITGKEQQRLRSVFEEKNIFKNSSSPYLQPTFSEMTWTTITSDTIATVRYGYHVNSASLVTLTLPLTADEGESIEVVATGAGGWKIAQNTGQSIVFGDQTTTTGTGGYLQSTSVGDAITLRRGPTSLGWEITSSIGNITFV